MNDIELTNRVIDFLNKELISNLSTVRRLTAQEIAAKVGGYAPSVGRCSDAILSELLTRGHSIRYDNSSNPKCFVLNSLS